MGEGTSFRDHIIVTADHSSRAVWGMNCFRPLEHWSRGFEAHRGMDVCLRLVCACIVLHRWRRLFKEPVSCPYSDRSEPRLYHQHFTSFISILIVSSMATARKWYLSFKFCDYNCARLSSQRRAYYVSKLSHPPWFDRANNIVASRPVAEWWLCKLRPLLGLLAAKYTQQ
jgi:hypothetical protein